MLRDANVFSCQWLINKVTLGLPADHNQSSCLSYAGWTDVLWALLLPWNTILCKHGVFCLKGAIWCISQPKKNRCALIMHHHFLTICWLNTANRCASSARIILCLLILSVCSGLFSLPCYDIWCLLTVLLPLCSVDHLCSGWSAHIDCHSHGGKAAAAHHSQVSMRMIGVCMINQVSTINVIHILDYAPFMSYWKRQDDTHIFKAPLCQHVIMWLVYCRKMRQSLWNVCSLLCCFQLMNDCHAFLYTTTRSRQSQLFFNPTKFSE